MPGVVLPTAARIAIGLVLVAIGLALAALGIFYILRGATPISFVAAPAGLAFALAGVIVLLPPRLARLRMPLGALMVTSLALVFDWVAFGPGERQFSSSASMGGVTVSSAHTGELAGRAFFGLFAVLMDIAAIGLWINLIRGR